MAHIAFLLDTDFEQVEYTDVKDKLIEKGHKTTLITTNDDKQVQGLHHTDKGDTFTADLLVADANADDYDAIVLPGGTVNADALRINEHAKTMVKALYDANKPVAAICHAPWILIDTGLAKGKTLTAYKTLQTDLQNAGASFKDVAMQQDGNLITSRTPDDIDEFVAAIDNAVVA